MSRDLPDVFTDLFGLPGNTPPRVELPLKPLEQEMRRQRARLLSGKVGSETTPAAYRRAARAARELAEILERLAYAGDQS